MNFPNTVEHHPFHESLTHIYIVANSQGFFNDLKASDAMGARLAIDYGRRSKAIGKALVADGVAHKDEDVNTVLLTGFFHVYGPINNYFD